MKFKYYSILSCLLVTASCSKEIGVEAPDFEVTTEAVEFKVGQEIKFSIRGGDAQLISFYSGEVLQDYAFKEGRAVDVKGAGATLAFQSNVQVGTQTKQLSVLASTDFNGDYGSLTKVKAATWTDITSRFVFGTTTAFLSSGIKDISDLLIPGKPIYFAFKYVTKPQATNGLARQWIIQNFAIQSTAKLDHEIALGLTDQAGTGFRIIDENAAGVTGPNFVPYDGAPARALVTNSSITLYGNQYLTSALAIFNPDNAIYDPANPIYDPHSPLYRATAVRPTYIPYEPANPLNDPLSEHWIVSKAISTEKVNLGPDRSVTLKGISNTNILDYRYTYTKAGTYRAVFVASNNSIDGVKKIVKEITLFITP